MSCARSLPGGSRRIIATGTRPRMRSASNSLRATARTARCDDKRLLKATSMWTVCTKSWHQGQHGEGWSTSAHPPPIGPYEQHPNPRFAGPGVRDVLRHHTVGLTGFEPAASSSRTRRATKLRHSPIAASGPSPGDKHGEHTGAVGRSESASGRGGSGAARGASVSRVASGRQATRTGRTARCPSPAETCSHDEPGSPGASRPGGGAGPWRAPARGRSW